MAQANRQLQGSHGRFRSLCISRNNRSHMAMRGSFSRFFRDDVLRKNMEDRNRVLSSCQQLFDVPRTVRCECCVVFDHRDRSGMTRTVLIAHHRVLSAGETTSRCVRSSCCHKIKQTLDHPTTRNSQNQNSQPYHDGTQQSCAQGVVCSRSLSPKVEPTRRTSKRGSCGARILGRRMELGQSEPFVRPELE